jgi:hypothetical protein
MKPAEETLQGIGNLRGTFELEGQMHEGLVHAIEQPNDSSNERVVSLLVGWVGRQLEVSEYSFESFDQSRKVGLWFGCQCPYLPRDR